MATIKLSTLIGQSEADIIKALNEEVVQPWHDCADSTYTSLSKQAILADTEYAFECNAIIRDVDNLPSHIDKLWDKTTNTAVFTGVVDTPLYVARIQFTFLPGTAAEGVMQFRAYINETVPVLIQQIRNTFKTTESRMEALFAFYLGSETGYDVKGKGMKFTYSSSRAGQVYDRGVLIYKT